MVYGDFNEISCQGACENMGQLAKAGLSYDFFSLFSDSTWLSEMKWEGARFSGCNGHEFPVRLKLDRAVASTKL